MSTTFRTIWMLLAALLLAASSTAWAQADAPSHISTDVALTFAVERAQIATSNPFWFQGGGADAALTFWKGLGAAVSFTGDHATQGTAGIDVNKMTWLMGPRYTFPLRTSHSGAAPKKEVQIFGQALFGGVHGFDGLYPATGGATTSANSIAFEFSGGANLRVARNLKLRLIELGFVHNQLPNAAANAQNNLRLAFGLCFTLPSKH